LSNLFADHSPISLHRQKVELIQASTLTVLPYTPATRARRASVSTDEVLSPLISPILESGITSPYIPCADRGEMANPQSPSNLFHHMGVSCPPCEVPKLDFVSVAVAAVVAHKIRERGFITGMPSRLDVDTEKTDMVRVEYREGEGSVMYINSGLFVPGSCVFYKTGVEGAEGVKELRRLIGTDRDSCAFDLMDRLSLGSVDASVCWFGGKNDITWPTGLKGAVEALGDVELNVALFRCGSEEKDLTNGMRLI
jgi:hypothetical protein